MVCLPTSGWTSWTLLLMACVILHVRLCDASEDDHSVEEILIKPYSPPRKNWKLKYPVPRSRKPVIGRVFTVPESSLNATVIAPSGTTSSPYLSNNLGCRDPPCSSRIASHERQGERKLYFGVNKDLGFMGHINKLTRKLFPHITKHIHHLWSGPLKRIVQLSAWVLRKFTGHFTRFRKNCATLVEPGEKQLPVLGTVRVADVKICGLKSIRTAFMRKTFHKTHWLFDSFILFKNLTISVGSFETKDAPIQFLQNLDISGLSVILEDVSPHIYFSVAVGLLPVITSWNLKIENPEGFKAEFGQDAGIVQKLLAGTITTMVRPIMSHTDVLVKLINSMVPSKVKHILHLLG